MTRELFVLLQKRVFEKNPGEAHQRRTADRLGAKWAELDTGHYPMLSTPTELTALLTAG